MSHTTSEDRSSRTRALARGGLAHGALAGVRATDTPAPMLRSPVSPVESAVEPTPRPTPGGAPWVAPAVLIASVLVHGAAAAAVLVLPAAPTHIFDEAELTFEIYEPPEQVALPEPEPVVEPEPEPEPEPERPAAVVDTPRQRQPVEPPPEPPPAPVMSAEGDDGTPEFQMPEGDASGVPGGQGTEPVAEAEPVAPAVVEPEAPRGISRAELRRRLLGYIRGTLGSFVANRVSYPLAARRDNLEGVAVLRIRLSEDGQILAVRLSRTSGHAMLDQAAIASVRGFGSMPAPPDSIPWDDTQELPLPVEFALR